MDLHERIAEALGWTEKEAKSFSLPSLREFVRTVNPKLAHEITFVMRSNVYYLGEPLKRKWLMGVDPNKPGA
jgi:hypothetical protein